MHKVRAVLTAVAVACTAAVTVTSAASPALAGPPALSGGVVLPIDNPSRVVVDPIHKRVLVTDPKAGEALWLSYFGGVQNRYTLAPGIEGIALTPDFSTAYFASSGYYNSISEYDMATGSNEGIHVLDPSLRVRTVAVAGGLVWFGYDTKGKDSPGGFGSLDPATDKVTLHDLPAAVHGAPELITSPGAPGTLVVADVSGNAETSGNLAVLDVTGAGPAVTSKGKFSDGLLHGVEVSADGSTLIGYGYGCLVWKAPIADPAKRAQAFHNGFCDTETSDVNTDGRVALGYSNTNGTTDVAISPAGSELPAEQFLAPNTDRVTHVTWEPGGDRLFVLSRGADAGNSEVRFWPLHGSQPKYTTLTATAPATTPVGVPLKITGTVGVPSAPVRLYRTDATAPGKTEVDFVQADAAGRFTLTDRPDAGTVKYTVSYAGDDTYAPISTTRSVVVSRNATALSLSPNNTVNNYGSTVTVTARLGKTYSNRTLEIWADPYGTEPLRLVRKTVTDAKGNLTAKLKLTRTTAVQVKFAGDAQYAPASARSVLNTRAAVSLQPSRQYRTAKVGSVTYRFFRKKVHPYFLTTMTPYPGRKQRLTLEVYSGGKWKAWRVLNLPLNAAGKSAFTLTGTHAVGAKYRARTGYVTKTSGDTVNYTNYSPYYYFTFTK
ncbi:hypothetical protein ACGFJ7_37370 [Actinoplanes sp. NPDC048988]|uniref:hypothetical protein n=1 Tax=Actinoplanes sp. NPDC048988 TaxID=3363901 RepID=UPI003710342C